MLMQLIREEKSREARGFNKKGETHRVKRRAWMKSAQGEVNALNQLQVCESIQAGFFQV